MSLELATSEKLASIVSYHTRGLVVALERLKQESFAHFWGHNHWSS